MQRTDMSEEEMRAFCEEIIPHIEAIKKAVLDNRSEEGVRIYISKDYLSVEGSGLVGWELHNYGKGYEMKLERMYPLEKEEKDAE